MKTPKILEEDVNGLVKILDKYLFGWEFKDIENASIRGGAKMAGFILGACFIDAMAGFYFGVTKKTQEKEVGKRFKRFTEKYLPQYDAKKFYEDLRCCLVHNYTEGGTYVFTDANKAGFHFETLESGKILLNLEDFISDLRSAYRSYRNDLLKSEKLQKKALERYNSLGLLQSMPVKR